MKISMQIGYAGGFAVQAARFDLSRFGMEIMPKAWGKPGAGSREGARCRRLVA